MSIALSQTAQADFTGLQTVERTDLPICQDQTEPEIPYKLDVCNVYAVFNNPGDKLISVAFSDGSTTDNNGFFQHSMNFASTAPACALVALEPTVECDSFITIGLDCFDLIDRTTTDPDWSPSLFENAGQIAGGWYNSVPDNGQGTPDENGNVLVAQFSVKQNKDVTGTLSIFAKLAGSSEITEYALQAFDCFGESAGGGGGPAPEPQSGGGAPLAGTIWYVDDDGAETNACITWTDACPELQKALSMAKDGDQIWVAEGTYLPDYDPTNGNHTGSRSATFQLIDGVDILGGYPNGGGHRDPLLYTTILSGDLDSDDESGGDNSENSYHVTTGSGTSLLAKIDGFTITAGHADPLPPGDRGAGMINVSGSPQVLSCTFDGNVAAGYNGWGGAMYNEDSSPRVISCTFTNNVATISGSGTGRGGAVFIGPTTGSFYDCSFSGNSGRAGGALYHFGGGLILTDCTFVGNSAGSGGGGAIRFDSATLNPPTVTNCTFTANTTTSAGGGLANSQASPEVTGCIFTGNSAPSGGGGMFNGAPASGVGSSPTVTNCTFDGNSSTSQYRAEGGGMRNSIDSNPLLTDCTFVNNWVSSPMGTSVGGGMANTWSNTPTLINCVFDGNTADFGGGISNTYGAPSLINCKFTGNSANAAGGAIENLLTVGNPSMVNCTFSQNWAGFAGGAIYSDNSDPTLQNSVLWSNSPSEIEGVDSTPAVTFSDIQGGHAGEGNIDVDPLFDADLRIAAGSPCIDAGDNFAVPPEIVTDLDGNPRVVDDPDTPPTGNPPGEDVLVDMGAYEFQPTCGLCPTDVDGDGNTGAYDLAFLLGFWGAVTPQTECLDADTDGIIGPFDLAFLLGNWGPCP